MKSKKLWTAALTLAALACISGAALNMQGGRAEALSATANPVTDKNCNLPAKTEAVTVSYDGGATARYGIQAYAGLEGAAWIMGDECIWLDYGAGSHAVGSNHSDGRSNLKLTFSIDSSAAGAAWLWLWSSGESEYYKGDLSVNGGSTVSVSLREKKKYDAWNEYVPARLPIVLTEGVNTVTLAMGEAYTGWFHSFAVSSADDVAAVLPDVKSIYPSGLGAASGDMNQSVVSFGVNAFDNAADYGKKGGTDYKFYAEKAGDYTLGILAMAGNPLANRTKLTLNDTVLKFGGKEYYSLDTTAGWSGDTWNYIKISLQKGINSLLIENSLTYVNASKTAELAPDEAGGVYVSNWWMKQLSLERVPETYFELDTSSVQKIYNPGRELSSEGLVAKYVTDGEARILTEEEYTIEAPTLTDYGSKEVKVTMKETGLTAAYSVNVAREGTPFAGKIVAFDGTQSTGKLSYYLNAEISGEGTGACEGRLFWITDEKTADGGYVFGSGGAGASENRQVTFTLKIDNTGTAGTYLIKSYANANNFTCNNATISVNGREAEAVNICAAKQPGRECVPYLFALELKEGENLVVLKMQDQYSVWWENFEICPLETEVKTEYLPEAGARSGIDCIETANGAWLGNENVRALSWWSDLTEAGNYSFTFHTETISEKSFVFVCDDRETTVNVSETGETEVSLDLTAGLHKFGVKCSGAAGNFDFYGFGLKKFEIPDSIVLDTLEMSLELENGGALNIAKLKVTAIYGETQRVLSSSEYVVVYPENYSVTTAGAYTITVKVAKAENITATFLVTVKEVRRTVGLEIDVGKIETEIENGGTLNTAALVVKAVYNDGTKETLTAKEYSVILPEGFDAEKAGTYTVKVELNADKEIAGTFEIKIKEKVQAAGCGSTVGIAGGAFAAICFVSAVLLKKKRDAGRK